MPALEGEEDKARDIEGAALEGALRRHRSAIESAPIGGGANGEHLQEDPRRLSVADQERKTLWVQFQRAQEREDRHTAGVHPQGRKEQKMNMIASTFDS